MCDCNALSSDVVPLFGDFNLPSIFAGRICDLVASGITLNVFERAYYDGGVASYAAEVNNCNLPHFAFHSKENVSMCILQYMDHYVITMGLVHMVRKCHMCEIVFNSQSFGVVSTSNAFIIDLGIFLCPDICGIVIRKNLVLYLNHLQQVDEFF
ncbi:hypothetical protein L6452_37714 [Arctium lappa]|uniref:Uncharacterized protein n=1 Tax=Arctium lappa TaxID=4217 RepID=A0ACB8Y2Z1_ARCLA|nr:hypothetical protein L6452_37714 [Arctium lappa]